jgi:hypothetical protein
MVRGPARKGWAGFVPPICLGVGAGVGGSFASAVGAFETPLALVGAVGGYLLSGAILRRIYSKLE